jgi:hypothetical protein
MAPTQQMGISALPTEILANVFAFVSDIRLE